jgi:hypothetical protein
MLILCSMILCGIQADKQNECRNFYPFSVPLYVFFGQTFSMNFVFTCRYPVFPTFALTPELEVTWHNHMNRRHTTLFASVIWPV